MRQAQFKATGSQPTARLRPADGTRLQVTWFSQWNVRLDDALSRLPESDACLWQAREISVRPGNVEVAQGDKFRPF